MKTIKRRGQKQIKPIFSMLTAAALKLVIDFFLIGREEVGMFGAAIGTVVFYFTATFLNFWFIVKSGHFTFRVREFLIKPFFISLIAVFCSYVFYREVYSVLTPILVLLLSILIAVFISYLIFKYLYRIFKVFLLFYII